MTTDIRTDTKRPNPGTHRGDCFNVIRLIQKTKFVALYSAPFYGKGWVFVSRGSGRTGRLKYNAPGCVFFIAVYNCTVPRILSGTQ
jgi:hypothetical protein